MAAPSKAVRIKDFIKDSISRMVFLPRSGQQGTTTGLSFGDGREGRDGG
jgi:hypothetical protein